MLLRSETTPRNTKNISKEEEKQLLTRYKNKSTPASERKSIMNALIMANYGIIFRTVRLASRWDRARFDDYFQIGIIGFMQGVEKFNINSGVRLMTYARHWIQAHTNRTFHVDMNLRAHTLYEHELQDDTYFDGDSGTAQVKDNNSYAQYCNDEQDFGVTFELDADTKSSYAKLKPVIDALPPIEKDFITKRIMTDSKASLGTIGSKYGCSRENVRQRGMRALKKLKDACLEKGIQNSWQ